LALGKDEDEQRLRFEEMLRNADLGIEELWLRYFSIGGIAGQFEVEAYIHGAIALPALQRDILAHALNERLDELSAPDGRAPYSRGSEDAGRLHEDRLHEDTDRPEDESGQED
jgi:hypothetical protein